MHFVNVVKENIFGKRFEKKGEGWRIAFKDQIIINIGCPDIVL